MQKPVRESLVALITIAIITSLYFFHLWYPTQKLLVTPDIGTSDAINLSLSQKYILSQSYARGELPLWENRVNAGFPMFAEGQIGALFLPNIILYRLFPFVTAYNASLVLSITIIAWGTYFWCRQWGVRTLIALLAGLTMAFSGVTVPHFTHITLLQGFSLMPIIAWLTLLLIEKPSYFRIIMYAIVMSQQVFAGFFQAAFITWVLTIFLAFTIPTERRLRTVLVVGFSILLGLGLSAIQILPSQEFLSQTTARYGFDQATASLFSFRLDNFLTIFHPFAIGNPKNATYSFDGNSIFWENNIFLGILPLLSVGFFWINKKTRKTLLPLVLLLALAVVLMMGKYSPAYLIYAFWPMNLFRVPSRYAYVFVFTAITLSALALNALKTRKAITILLILIQGSVLWYVWRNYHVYDSPDRWLSKPEIFSYIPQEGYVLSLDAVAYHKGVFLHDFGFADIRPYRFLRNTLQPYINVLWDVRQLDTYPSRVLRRPGIANALMRESFEDKDKSRWEKLLTLFSVRYVLSHKPIEYTTLIQKTVIRDLWMRVYVYENIRALPRTYKTRDLSLVKSQTDAREAIDKDSFVPGVSALIEGPLDLSDRSLQVIQQAWYPGWTAYVDGKKEEVIPVNIRMSGILIPDGIHEIVLRYEPISFSRGLQISVLTATTMILIGLIGGAYQSAIDWRGKLPHIS